MKTKKFEKKLTLNKKTIAALQSGEMKDVYGGVTKITICWGTLCASMPGCVC